MASKKDIQRLLKKGLTGWEAGLLVFEDSWLVEHNHKGFLSDSDLAALKSGLQREKEIQDYNLLIRLYRASDFIDKQASIALFAATAMLERAAGLGYLRMAPIFANYLRERLPAIVTEKQYQDIKARQRESKLQESLELYDVLYQEAGRLASPEQEEEADGYIQAYPPEIRARLVEGLLEKLQEGRLRPVQLREEDRKAIRSLEEKIDVYRERSKPGQTREELVEALSKREFYPAGWTLKDEQDLDNLLQQQDELLEQALERASQVDTANLVAFLEKLRDGSLSEEDWQAQPPVYFSQEELYQAGLPESVRWVDEFTTSLDEDSAPAYAILQEPPEHMLDERGYYQDSYLTHWPFTPMEEADLSGQQTNARELALEEIALLLARRQVLEDISHYTGLNIYELSEISISGMLKPAIGRYNTLADTIRILHGWPDAFLQEQDYRPIQWKELETPEDELAKVREWISEILGEDWWKGVQDRHKEPRAIIPIPEDVRPSVEKEAADGQE